MPEQEDDVDAVLRALAHPVRRVIVQSLARSPSSVSDLAATGAHELEPTPDGTRLHHTEHGIHLDGFDDGARRRAGTVGLLDRLAAHLSTTTTEGRP